MISPEQIKCSFVYFIHVNKLAFGDIGRVVVKLPLRYTWTSRFFLCKGEDNGAWCPECSDNNLNWEVRFPRLMAVSGLNFEHPSQEDVYTYPNMFMKTLQLKFISALDPLREWRSYTKVKESFEIIWCFYFCVLF